MFFHGTCTDQMAEKCSLSDGMSMSEWCTEGKVGAVKDKQLMNDILLNSAAKTFSEEVKSFTLELNCLDWKPTSATQ